MGRYKNTGEFNYKYPVRRRVANTLKKVIKDEALIDTYTLYDSVKINAKVTTEGNLRIEILAAYYFGYLNNGTADPFNGVVGKDMTAVAIQTGITASKVQQLNQAWDAFMQDITGGTQGLGSLVNSIKNIGQVTQSQSSKLGQFGGNLCRRSISL